MAEKLPETRQRRIGPSVSTSLTPEARSIRRVGGAPTKLTSTLWIGRQSAMLSSLGARKRAEYGGIACPVPDRPARHPPRGAHFHIRRASRTRGVVSSLSTHGQAYSPVGQPAG